MEELTGVCRQETARVDKVLKNGSEEMCEEQGAAQDLSREVLAEPCQKALPAHKACWMPAHPWSNEWLMGRGQQDLGIWAQQPWAKLLQLCALA